MFSREFHFCAMNTNTNRKQSDNSNKFCAIVQPWRDRTSTNTSTDTNASPYTNTKNDTNASPCGGIIQVPPF